MWHMDLFTVSFEKSHNTNEVTPNLSFNPLKYKVSSSDPCQTRNQSNIRIMEHTPSGEAEDF